MQVGELGRVADQARREFGESTSLARAAGLASTPVAGSGRGVSRPWLRATVVVTWKGWEAAPVVGGAALFFGAEAIFFDAERGGFGGDRRGRGPRRSGRRRRWRRGKRLRSPVSALGSTSTAMRISAES